MNNPRTLSVCAGLALAATNSTHAQIEWEMPVNGSWYSAVMWNPDEIPNNVGESAVLSVGGMPYTVTLSANNPTIDSLGVNSTDASVAISNRVLTIWGGLLNNNGNVFINATASSTSSIRFRNTLTATLSGSGTTTLSSNPISDLSATIASTAFDDTVLTIGPLHTVTGTGAVTIPFENEGSMLADGGTLTLVPGFNEVATCSGQLQSTNAGILRLKNINLDLLSTGTALADGGDFEFDGQTQSQRLANGTIASANGGVYRSVQGNAEFENITLNGDATGNTRRGFRLFGATFTNNGTVSLTGDGVNGFTALSIHDSPYIIDGNGEVILDNMPTVNPNTAPAITDSVGSALLTNGANHTIRGNGRTLISINNLGTISADIANKNFEIVAGTLTNQNTLRATNQGVLMITSDVIQMGAGFIDLDNGFLDFGANAPSASLTGGSVLGTNGGKATIQSGNVDMTGVTLNCDTDLLGQSIVSLGGMVNNGSMLLQLDGGNFGILNFAVPQTWAGTGEIVLNADSDALLQYAQLNRTTADDVVIHAPTHTIRGTGRVFTAIDNRGLINADVNGRTLQFAGDDKFNAGIIRADSGILALETVTLDQTDTGNGAGTIEAINGGQIVLGGNGGATLIGGSVDVTGGVMRVSSPFCRVQDFSLDGTFELDSSLTEFAGTINNDGVIWLSPLGANIRNMRLDGNVALQGDGQFRLGGLGDTLIASVVPLAATATLDHGIDHTVEGTGSFSNTNITNHGTFAPGESNNPGNEIGNIQIGNSSNLTCTATSYLEIQIAGTGAAEFDRITDSGSAQSTFHCDGALNISNISGFSGLAPGDSLEIISSPGGRTGTFSSVTYPGQINYAIEYQPDGVLLIYNCLADVNHDGSVTPADFTAWLDAFNNNLPECDQNGDGACTPTDFTAWIANFNAGC